MSDTGRVEEDGEKNTMKGDKMQIASIVDDLGASQRNFYMIKEFNKGAVSKDLSMGAFYNRPSMCITTPHFSCKNISFLSGYHGVAISTTIEGADSLLKSHNNSDKYLYLWNIEWLSSVVNFDAVCRILLDDRLKIIARSDSHAVIINNFCNKEVSGVVDNWNIDELRKIIH